MGNLLMGFGVKESEALKLRRWDRVHMIREFSTMAEKTGVAKNLHKYARGDVTKSSVGATGMSALESFGEKCQQIWKRQKASLSKATIPAAAAPSKQAKHSTNNNKKGKTEKSDDSSSSSSEDSDDDDDFARDIERTLNARAAATATMEANETARIEKERKVLEDEKKEYSSIKSFMDTLGGNSTSAITSNKNNNSSSSSNNAGAASSSSLLPAITPRKKIQVGAPVITLDGSGGDINTLPSGNSSWVRPRRVVKRLIRSVNAEGIETIRVEYLFGPKEVDRVEKENNKMKKEREYKRSGHGSADHAIHDDEIEDMQVGTTMASMSLNIGKMKKAVDQNNVMKKQVHGLGGLGLDPEEVYALKQMKSAKRSSHVTPLSYRLPRVSLAVRLEKELLSLWMSKNASFFWFPVNRLEPGYYEKIQNPICMKDIREKIASFQYETANAMIKDVELMANNASLFNGAKSIFAVTAYKLLDQLKTSINHEQVHFGIDKDTIRLMEEAIKKKNIQYGRDSNRSGGVNDSGYYGSAAISSLLPPSTNYSSKGGVTSSSSGVDGVLMRSNFNPSLLNPGGLTAADSLLDMNEELDIFDHDGGGVGYEDEDIMDTADGLTF
eukprot:NODE_135_length_2032_cov_270.275340_g102_i0.p1 GENE.NODE_135_length_2032_cov_270.275340_g102_i0~~NODE_135_length_2032_cov_270.275340_g102_i0.p1  ORF type:complete len:618 (+),score=44.83 NODE_135_length_2032_cov_270.275340_g102_i0:23-1855(+)